MNRRELTRLVRRAFALPPHVVAAKALGIARRKLEAPAERKRDLARPTHTIEGPQRLARLATLPECLPDDDAFATACRLYLAHHFDVLGSGWVDASYGAQSPGAEGRRFKPGPRVDVDAEGRWLAGRVTRPNLAETQRRWRLVSPAYSPIDWYRDYRSGYRFSPRVWYRDAAYGDVIGADVKVPWELARAQHLPQLALWAATLPPPERDRVGREICDEVLDFSATNPPRFGCNWYVTMDVGIRVANWCLAFDLVRAAGFEAESEVEAALARAVHEHAAFIADNLEWFPDLRSNHYLGNIAGLAFAAAYLPPSPETDSWLSFAAAALVQELTRQFEDDGGNFEGSVAYHRLSAEELLWGLAVVRALPDERAAALGAWDEAHVSVPEPPEPVSARDVAEVCGGERIARIAQFALDATRPDGRVVQFGDMDSGRFVKIAPVLTAVPVSDLKAIFANLEGWRPSETVRAIAAGGGEGGAPRAALEIPLEEHLDVRHLAALAGVLTGDRMLEASAGDAVEPAVLRALMGPEAVPGHRFPWPARDVRVGDESAFFEAVDRARAAGDGAGAGSLERRFEARAGYLDGLVLAGYPRFGLWTWRAAGLFLAIRCGQVGQYGAGGHSHNDQLAMELWLDGRPLAMDPGTYAYTHLPERRNEYRSVAAHDAPRVDGREPALLTHGLFQIEGARPGVCTYFGPRGFAGSHDGYRRAVTRVVELHEDAVVVRDAVEGGGAVDVATAVPLYSPGAGMRVRPEALAGFLALREDRGPLVGDPAQIVCSEGHERRDEIR